MGMGFTRVFGGPGKITAELEPYKLQPDEMPEVSTIDRYQGAENQIVIISLVRSNAEKKLGFLGTDDGKNRMCVAQSRAKCGLYFVGNEECLRSAVHWKQLLDMLQERGSVGDKFPQICPRHPDIQNFAHEAEDVGIVCKKICGKAFGCGIAGIETPAHVFRDIPCHREIESLPCPFFEMLRCQRGRHDVKRICGQSTESAVTSCDNPCQTQLACGHMCPNMCSEVCILATECPALKDFECPVCPAHPKKAKIRSECSSTKEQIAAKCMSRCSKLLACGHHCAEVCSKPCTTRCEKDCKKLLSCGHLCPKKCFEACAAVTDCVALRWFQCPTSAEHGKIRSKCNSTDLEIAASCRSECSRRLRCGHLCQEMTWCFMWRMGFSIWLWLKIGEKCGDPCTTTCQMPCGAKLTCGHQCPRKCSETCLEANACEEICGQKLSCGHSCEERCREPCICKKQCTKELQCGHRCGMKCHEECKCLMPKMVPCIKTMGRETPHQEKEEDIAVRCRQLCGERLPCGHTCKKVCCECMPHEAAECTEVCGRELPCGHTCSQPCSQPCSSFSCPACERPPLPKAMPKPPSAAATAATAVPEPLWPPRQPHEAPREPRDPRRLEPRRGERRRDDREEVRHRGARDDRRRYFDRRHRSSNSWYRQGSQLVIFYAQKLPELCKLCSAPSEATTQRYPTPILVGRKSVAMAVMASISPFQVSAKLALTGEVVATVRVTGTETVAMLCQLIARATGEASSLRLLLEGRLLEKHQNLASAGVKDDCSVEIVKDQRLVLTASHDGTAKIWRADDGKCLRTLSGHSNAVNAARFSCSGLYVATASLDQTAKLWMVSTGNCEATLHGHRGSLVSVDFSPDDALLVTASSSDNSGRIWNLQSMECQMILEGYELNSARFTADGWKVLTACSWYDCALLWCVKTGNILQRFAPHDAAVLHSCVSHDASTVATATWDGALILWWAETGQLRRRLTGFGEKSKVYAAFSPDDQRVVSAGINHVAQIWSIEPAGASPMTLSGHGNTVTSAEFSADGVWVVTGSYDGTARIWDSVTGETLRTLKGHSDSVRKPCCQCDADKDSNEATIKRSLPAMTDEDDNQPTEAFVVTEETVSR
eukprot:s3374_g9.t1